ncbi:glycosyltransferase family 2 protein [Flavivirga sp. 57AJ16]|uniref:glycosyltransferase family 2 protein n=1 Tax=Flavivirga sp. 57AJ16 TaxID=3025307 RepID=UPI00236656C8|nr:glycosyltransferase family 2 protein [Flavivirga sp. 57AJ16]MDD7885917.1 glycosyltransferase family 2 protein [Flavivirga sp. 57AJ16]
MMVSIITPVHNSANHISKNIESVQKQIFRDYEHIIIDDCSSDNTVSIIKDFIKKNNKIRLIQLQNNSGAGFARNRGIKEAKGRYIAFLDSDDFWALDKLEKQISFMRENNFPFTHTQYYEFDDKTGQIKTLVKCPEKVTYQMILRNGGHIGCLTVVYDTNFFGKRYMPEIRKRQDWALWIKMLKGIDCSYGIREPLAYYRTGNSSLSKSKIKLVRHNFMVYRRELKMSFVESFYRMTIFLVYHFLFKRKAKVKL